MVRPDRRLEGLRDLAEELLQRHPLPAADCPATRCGSDLVEAAPARTCVCLFRMVAWRAWPPRRDSRWNQFEAAAGNPAGAAIGSPGTLRALPLSAS